MMFRSQEHAANDGMDIGLCALNKKNNILQFSGAHRPLIIIRDHQMSEHKGSPRSIGGHMDQEPIPFHCIEFPVKKGDVLILTSDGYSDQFGGEKGKKMKFKNFKNLLMKFHIRPMNLMEKVLDVEFEVWKGDLEQVDDVCVMGLRL
jgi:serine phosphatase RsbU (regulator of sigma subunit)